MLNKNVYAYLLCCVPPQFVYILSETTIIEKQRDVFFPVLYIPWLFIELNRMCASTSFSMCLFLFLNIRD